MNDLEILQNESGLDSVLVTPERKDYEIECRIDHGGMLAYAKVSTDAEKCGVNEHAMLCALYAAGIREGIDYSKIAEIAADGIYNKEMIVARGFSPVSGKNAKIVLKARLEEFSASGGSAQLANLKIKNAEIVSPGQTLAVKQPLSKGKLGINVHGDRLESNSGKDVDFAFGENVELSEDGLQLLSSIRGYVGIENGRIVVKAPGFDEWKHDVVFRNNNMEAFLVITPGLSKQPEYDEKWFKRIIAESGIKFGVEREAYNFIPKNMKKPCTIKLAAGILPMAGRSAWIVERFKAPGRDNFIMKVSEGDLIAEKMPGTKSADGRNVLDEPIPARHMPFVPLKAGKNARISDDGSKVFSQLEGYVVADGHRYSVVKGIEVDFSNGAAKDTVTYDGVVRVKGSVPPGKKIVAGSHVEISGDVEDAEVVAGGILCLRGRAMNCQRARIQSGGDMCVGAAVNSIFKAGGDFMVRGALLNCNVLTDGSVCKWDGGRTIVAGGRIVAAKDADIDVLGSEKGAPTRISVGTPYSFVVRYAHAAREIAEVRDTHDRIKAKLRGLQKLVDGEKASMKDFNTYKKLVVAEKEYGEMLELAKTSADSLREKIIPMSAGRTLKVNEAVHPGVFVNIGPFPYTVTAAMKKCSFSISPEGKRILIT